MTQRGKTKVLVREFAFSVASYLLRWRWFIAGGHRPPAGHRIPEGFAGVGVAASADPRGDDYIMARLDEAGLRHVRPGQRVSATLDEDAWRLTKMWIVGIGDDHVVR